MNEQEKIEELWALVQEVATPLMHLRKFVHLNCVGSKLPAMADSMRAQLDAIDELLEIVDA